MTAVMVRWLHLYVSLVSFGVVLFFSLTGLTLNHPTWFGGNQQVTETRHGQLDRTWVKQTPANTVAKLEIVEHLRSIEHLRGAAKEFAIDDLQCVVGFRAPGYSADAFIDRENASYEIVETSFGVIAVLNDLHKGRDSGFAWSVVIDIAAIVLIVVSLTGFCLLFYIRRRRFSGLMASILGLAFVILIYVCCVPR